jgi:hypothetical protein
MPAACFGIYWRTNSQAFEGRSVGTASAASLSNVVETVTFATALA